MIKTTNNYNFGKFLGYPKCCIEAFGDVAIPFVMRPTLTQMMTVNGFFPYVSCAEKLFNKEITYNELINPNRKCSVPFTETPTPQEDQIIGKELDQIRE
jgi:hypothetical protein